MLTKNLLEFRTRQGHVHPKFISGQADELELAETLVARVNAGGTDDTRGALESDLTAAANGHRRPRIAKGLVKLLLDRSEFEEPAEEATASRAGWLDEAQTVRRALSADASFEAYEEALAAALGDLDRVRDQLYADLPERRRLVDFKPIDAPGLLARYDLAQVQGLLLHAQRLELTVDEGDTPELRRVLRWMRFCRLVADVRRGEPAWTLSIEGPAAVIDGAKKYGLQLASFFSVVPTLPAWRVTAEVRLPRRTPLRLELSHEAGLKPGFEGGAGHVPPEMRAVLERWSDDQWRLDPNPPPRAVGVSGWCQPDFAAERDGRVVAIELFHPWHRGALPRRLGELSIRPEPELLLGVDRKLARALELDPPAGQLFEFSGFPTERVLKRALATWWERFGGSTEGRRA